MSGSIAAIAAYNGTGTQSHGTVDEQDQGVKSVFWNDYDTDKHFVNGCSLYEVSSNKGTITTPETIVFTFDNDIDAISDLQLVVETNNVTPNSTSTLPGWWMALLIERVEMCVGNQVISTINTAGLLKSFIDTKDTSFYIDKIPAKNGILTGSAGAQLPNLVSSTFKLPIFNTLKNDVDCSYLMGLANNQVLQVKVYPQNLTKEDFNNYTVNSVGDSLLFHGSDFTFRLFSNKSTMTNAERNLLNSQVVPKRTNITQVATPTTLSSNFKENQSITINCDHFNIYADALYVVAAEIKGKVVIAFDIEVFLNSTSYSGILPPEITQKLISDSSRIPPAGVTPAQSGSDLDDVYYYKIPLSNLGISKDQDYVPLGKYDSIRVVLTPVFTTSSGASPQSVSSTFKNTLSVIATGKATGLYQNGAVTFNTF